MTTAVLSLLGSGVVAAPALAAPVLTAPGLAAGDGPPQTDLDPLRPLAYYAFEPDGVIAPEVSSVPSPEPAYRNGAGIDSEYEQMWGVTGLAPAGTLRLDGVDDVMSAPVTVAADQSFSVSVWVRPTQIVKPSAAVSQDGGRTSAFALQVSSAGKWQFAMPRTDVDAPTWDAVDGPAAVAEEWTHLLGIFDQSQKQLRFYVNGQKVGSVAHAAGWKATGELQAGRRLVAGKPANYLGGRLDGVRVWQTALSDVDAPTAAFPARTTRTDRCRLGNWLHAGGPQVKALAATSLAGTETDARRPWGNDALHPGTMHEAWRTDSTTVNAARDTQAARYTTWGNVIKPYSVLGSTETDFYTVPRYGDPVLTFLSDNQLKDFDDLAPATTKVKPSAEVVALAKEIRAKQYAAGDTWLRILMPTTLQIDAMSADEIAAFIRVGGIPLTAPVKDSAEHRIEVEDLKAHWADCEIGGTRDPFNKLVDIRYTANQEWQAELAAQATQRTVIVAAEIQAAKDLRTASNALIEAQGQAWVTGQLLKWQRYWLSKPAASRPTAAQFTKATNDMTAAKTAVAAKLTTAQNAAASAKTQAYKATAARDEAGKIAEANGTPYGRGLMYARQSATVTKASAASAQAVSKAIETTLNAMKAANADVKALQGLAKTQTAAARAEFLRAAAKEAADQAHLAAVGARKQADLAAAAAARAKSDRLNAEDAEQIAKVAAADAAKQRGIAEQEASVAAEQRAVADTQRNRAAADEAEAQRQGSVAADARSRADADADTAKKKRAEAEQAEAGAKRARDSAALAEQLKISKAADASAAVAWAEAAEGTDAAEEARAAADDAQLQADRAAGAATSARAAANDATAAAVAAREAATKATAAAGRANAAATQARADAEVTRRQSLRARAYAADSIKAAEEAAEHVKTAEKLTAEAHAHAAKAKADTVAARQQADIARREAAKTAGYAYAAAQAAIAARDSAAEVIKPANEAAEIGGPFRDRDASAGLAVLVADTAKTLAEQQEAAAQARAAEAAQAAKDAADLAAKADADAKAAAQSAAYAADEAAKASQALADARRSAAAAAADSRAAVAAADRTQLINEQAQRDAGRATIAATSAEADAAAARESATEAERDAAGAHQAADKADEDAKAAQDSATSADKDATAAEKAAENAQGAAQDAEDSKTRTENDKRAQAVMVSLSGEGPTGTPGLMAVPDIKDEATPASECVTPWDNLNVCDMKVKHHVTGTVTYLVLTCPDPAQTYCPDAFTIDRIDTVAVDETNEVTERLDLAKIRAELLKGFAWAMISDYVDCFSGAENWKSACAWVGVDLLGATLIKAAAKAVVALRRAIRIGDGIEEALAAAKLEKIDKKTMALLEKNADEAMAATCIPVDVNSFAPDTPVIMSDGGRKPISAVRIGDLVRTADPIAGRTVVRKVTNVFRHQDTAFTDVLVRDAAGRLSVVNTTPQHRFWDGSKRLWVEAAALTAGSPLRTPDGRTATVAEVRSFAGSKLMYDLSVTEVNTFFVVAGETPVLVHNARQCKIRISAPAPDWASKGFHVHMPSGKEVTYFGTAYKTMELDKKTGKMVEVTRHAINTRTSYNTSGKIASTKDLKLALSQLENNAAWQDNVLKHARSMVTYLKQNHPASNEIDGMEKLVKALEEKVAARTTP